MLVETDKDVTEKFVYKIAKKKERTSGFDWSPINKKSDALVTYASR
jgi:hypothetical protein